MQYIQSVHQRLSSTFTVSSRNSAKPYQSNPAGNSPQNDYSMSFSSCKVDRLLSIVYRCLW